MSKLFPLGGKMWVTGTTGEKGHRSLNHCLEETHLDQKLLFQNFHEQK